MNIWLIEKAQNDSLESFAFFFFFKKCPFSTKWSFQIKVVLLKCFWTLIYTSAAYFLKEGVLEGSSQKKTAMVFIKSITYSL